MADACSKRDSGVPWHLNLKFRNSPDKSELLRSFFSLWQMRPGAFDAALFGQYTIIIRFMHLLISIHWAYDDVFGSNSGLSCHDIFDLGSLCIRQAAGVNHYVHGTPADAHHYI